MPSRATSGSTTGGHIAFYDLATFGSFYGASSKSFSYFTNRTTRSTGGFGRLANDTEHGNFDSHEFRTRLEFGRHFDGKFGLGAFGEIRLVLAYLPSTLTAKALLRSRASSVHGSIVSYLWAGNDFSTDVKAHVCA